MGWGPAYLSEREVLEAASVLLDEGEAERAAEPLRRWRAGLCTGWTGILMAMG